MSWPLVRGCRTGAARHNPTPRAASLPGVPTDPLAASPWAPLPELARELQRVAERLRSMSEARLARACPPYGSAADAGRWVAQHLADAAAELEGLPRRAVPVLSPLAVGDQVALTGSDAWCSAAALPADAVLASGRTARDVVAAVLTDLAAVRRAL